MAGSVARAADDSFTEAQAGLANAYSNYYRELRKNPGFTQDQAKEVADRILSPAHAKVARALEQDFRKTYETASTQQQQQAGAGAKPGTGGAPEGDAKPPQEEVVIDGSSVPAELEFPGKTARKSGASAPARVPGAAPGKNIK